MHQPATAPRASIFYRYQVYPFRRPPELEGRPLRHPVAIVGGGPIGLTLALDLARQGIDCVLLTAEQQVSEGSRALAYTRRSLEILQQSGVGARIAELGLPWRYGTSFYRGRPVYRLDVPYDDDDRFAPLTNLQQQWLEQALVERIAAHAPEADPPPAPVGPAGVRPGRIDLRWGHKLVDLHPAAEGVDATIDTPQGEYRLQADWLVACDGARSTVRQSLGLRMDGASYEGRFVIADIRAELDLPTERRAYFDPDWNPGNTVLMHREPFGLWRIDFQLPAGETAEQALQPDSLKTRIDAQLAMIGKAGTPWELDWCSVYSARAMTLADYVHGRVLFAGDAAHMLPIFGVRGANTGWQDGHNLAWKLALAVRGVAGPNLLPSYTHERVKAAREIIDEASKSVRFMTPPTAGFRLLRDAVLSLSLSQSFARPLLNWRTSRPHEYTDSPLNAADDDNGRFSGGWPHGAPLRNLRVLAGGREDEAEGSFLMDRLGAAFYLFLFGPGNAVPAALAAEARDWSARGVPVQIVRVQGSGGALPAAAVAAAPNGADLTLDDPDGHLHARFGIDQGAGAVLLRPDHHVCARWLAIDAARLNRALRRATGFGDQPADGYAPPAAERGSTAGAAPSPGC